MKGTQQAGSRAIWATKVGLQSFRGKDFKVSFVIAGFAKAGTTALKAYLLEHPELYLAPREVHFFSQDWHFTGRSRKSAYARYHARFWPSRRGLVVGEKTPTYIYREDALELMREYNPQMRIILTLRNPIERAFSHWNMDRDQQRSVADAPFGEIIRSEATSGFPLARAGSYVSRGFYAQQIERLWTYFDRDQVMIIDSTDLRSDPDATLGRVTDFLGVSPFPPQQKKTVHARPYTTSLSTEDWQFLRDAYAGDVGKLSEVLDRDFSHWLSRPTNI